MVRPLIALLSTSLVIYVTSPVIISWFENAFLGPLRRRTSENFVFGFAKRWSAYFALPALFWLTGLGVFFYSHPGIQKALETLKKVVPKDHPYAPHLLESITFSFPENANIMIIIMTIFIVSLARITTLLYHPFVFRTLLFYTFGTLGFLWIVIIVNPLFHTLIFDHAIQKGFPNSLKTLFAGGLICGLWIECILDRWLIQCGYKAGTTVFRGTYICKKCHKDFYVGQDSGILPICKRCKGERYRRDT